MKINFLLFAFFFALSTSLFSQFSSEKNISSSCGTCVFDEVFMVDMDGDGDKDLLTSTNLNATRIVWYENDGSGNMSSHNFILAQEKGLINIDVADLDGDGDLDVISNISLGTSPFILAWHENDGNGKFFEQKIISTNNRSPLHVSDLDGDGDMDILSNSKREGTILMFENNGTANFVEQDIIPHQTEGAARIHTTDLDGDGDLDILFSLYHQVIETNKIAWYENDGNGSFLDYKIISEQTNGVSTLYTADIDEDGDEDVFTVTKNELAWYENDGIANLSEKRIISSSAAYSQVIYINDMDGDGHKDIFMDSNDNQAIVWYKNDGNSIFSEQKIISNQSDLLIQVYADDMDEDEDPDLLCIYEGDNRNIVLYENDGTANFSERKIFYSQTLKASDVHASDLDGDGDLDILSASQDDNKVAWYENDGTGNFSEQKIITTQAQGASNVSVGDLDGDGDLDVLSASQDDNKVAWYENDGIGNFSEQKTITTQSQKTSSVSVEDLDGDGDLDVLLTAVFGITIVWYANDGNGNFTEQHIISTEHTYVFNAHTSDIDLDGDIDIFLAYGKYPDYTVSWYVNDGMGNFSTEKIISTSKSSMAAIYSADIDKDGDMDILIGSSNGTIAWYQNNGTGDFSVQHIISTDNIFASRVHAADLDLDGDMDVLLADWTSGKIVWHENDGTGRFSSQNIISNLALKTVNIYVADLDKDGDIDVLSASQTYDKIAWYENLIDSPSISGTVFEDKNGNGLKDEEDKTLTNFPIKIRPNALSSYTDENGVFRYFLPNGTYDLSVVPDSCWALTIDSSNYSITLDENKLTESVAFGLQLASNYQHTQARVISTPTRCSFEVPFYLSVQNDGCQPSKGQYGLVLSPLITLVDAEIEPQEIRNDTLLWNYEELFSLESKGLQLIFKIAGTDFIGDLIEVSALSYVEKEQGELELASTYEYRSLIRCAYDPNDKLVIPNRAFDTSAEYDQNYTLFEEQLEYTIRFQNTGNDTAFNVVLRDTLDKNLDWNTFKPVIASHPYETVLKNKEGAIEFSFRDILLPDSTTNEPLSHGFVTYKIAPKQGLPENTRIENTASIYFDFNPPIVTNTTQNVMVSELPKTRPIMDTTQVVYVQLKAYLGGAYEKNTGLMRDNLRTLSYIPIQEPYTLIEMNDSKRFVHYGAGGGEIIQHGVLEVEGENAIVDWIFLEIRSSEDETNIVQTRSALIQRDGDIVEMDGVSPVAIPATEGDYYIVLKHRNHLGVMTKAPVTLRKDKNRIATVDFTNTHTGESWGLDAQKIVGDMRTMWEGNTNDDRYIIFLGGGVGMPDPDGIFFTIFSDKENQLSNYNHISHGYFQSDVNLDGIVNYQGVGTDLIPIFFNVLYHPKNVNFFTNFFIDEQIPIKNN